MGFWVLGFGCWVFNAEFAKVAQRSRSLGENALLFRFLSRFTGASSTGMHDLRNICLFSMVTR
jgi:hypothetical protein